MMPSEPLPARMSPDLITLLPPDDPRVAPLCERLGEQPAESFFLTRWWLEACLATWPVQTGHCVLALGSAATPLDGAAAAQPGADAPRPVDSDPGALALLGSRTQRRHGWLRVRQVGLNVALDDDLDEPTMELNGFYGATPQDFSARFDALLGWLGKRRDWDELRVPGVISARAAEVEGLAQRHGLRVRTEKQAQTWWLDLDRLRARGSGDWLDTLSANTRQQLRRARRAIEKAHGPLSVRQAGSVDEALEWMDALADLHRARWAVPGTRSGFDIPSFRAFQRDLVRRAFPVGGVQMLRIAAGDEPLAWLYNLVLDGHVHFLMSGIDYARFERFRPGMLAHQMAIEHNLAAGARIYDFLGGSQRYKASFATDGDTQHWLVLWRPRPGLLLEDLLRRARQRWRAARQPRAAGSATGLPTE